MASLVGIIPPLCSCGKAIGRLQADFEDTIKQKDFNETMVSVYSDPAGSGGFEPQMCCRIQFLNPQRFIPDDTFDRRTSNGDKFDYVPSVKPRIPL